MIIKVSVQRASGTALPPSPLALAGLAVGVLLFASSCDTAPEPVDRAGSPPFLSDFSFSPSRVLFEELPPSQVVADTLARVPVRLSVRVQDPDADVASVTYSVLAPLPSGEAYQEGELGRAIGDRFDREFVLELPRGGEGPYELVVYAVDGATQVSNQVRGTIHFEVAQGRPPVVVAVEAPATFRPPGTLRLVAVVSDPDGLSNIRSVFVKTPTGVELPMFDDGETQGDEKARDGRYTASFNVPSASPGPQVFRFRAVDRSGLVSETVEWTITIES